MKHRHIISFLLPLLFASCAKTSIEEPAGQPSGGHGTGTIDASCSVVNVTGSDDGQGLGIATRSIIGQTTIASIDANFIKLDETVTSGWTQEDYVMKDFTGWTDPQTRILDASILSSPDNTKGIYLRSIYFNPRQTYQYTM